MLGQELYQLSKEKADFSVAAGEEDESPAGSSGENEGNSRSSTPHSAVKTPPSKSPAKAQKPEGEVVLSQGVFPAFGAGWLWICVSVRCSKIPRQLSWVCQGEWGRLFRAWVWAVLMLGVEHPVRGDGGSTHDAGRVGA